MASSSRMNGSRSEGYRFFTPRTIVAMSTSPRASQWQMKRSMSAVQTLGRHAAEGVARAIRAEPGVGFVGSSLGRVCIIDLGGVCQKYHPGFSISLTVVVMT